MTILAEACADASFAVDAVYGERWLYQPMHAPDTNARPASDPARMAIEIDGVYVGPFARAESRQARRHGVTPERPGHAASRPYLDLALANLPYAPRVGDQTTRLKDGKRYRGASGWHRPGAARP